MNIVKVETATKIIMAFDLDEWEWLMSLTQNPLSENESELDAEMRRRLWAARDRFKQGVKITVPKI